MGEGNNYIENEQAMALLHFPSGFRAFVSMSPELVSNIKEYIPCIVYQCAEGIDIHFPEHITPSDTPHVLLDTPYKVKLTSEPGIVIYKEDK